MSDITIIIKCANAATTEIKCSTSLTILEFKGLVEKELSVEVARQRLIYRGKVLKDDSTLETYNVLDRHAIHMVKGAAPKPAQASSAAPPSAANRGISTTTPSTTPSSNATPAGSNTLPSGANPAPTPNPSANPFNPFGNAMGGMAGMFGAGGGAGGMPTPQQVQQQLMQNPEAMQNMMQSPMMQNLMSNPDILNNMISNNPQMQAMLDTNPHIRHVLNDPETMRRTMEMMRNPTAMREAIRHQDMAMAQLENHPQGYAALRRMYEDVQEPMMDAMNEAQNQTTPSNQGQSTSSGPLPNPWASSSGAGAGAGAGGMSNPFAGMGGPGAGGMPNPFAGMGGAGAGGMPNPFAGMGGAGAGGMPNPFAGGNNGQMMEMLRNPMVQQQMQQVFSNPQMMEQAIRMDPNLARMVESNPQMRSMLSNPDMMRQMLNPDNLNAMMQMQQAMGQLQGSGLMGAASGGGGGGIDFSSLLGGMGGLPGVPTGVPVASGASVDPAVTYASQISQLQDMGFSDAAANGRALLRTQGNINAAVELLLSGTI